MTCAIIAAAEARSFSNLSARSFARSAARVSSLARSSSVDRRHLGHQRLHRGSGAAPVDSRSSSCNDRVAGGGPAAARMVVGGDRVQQRLHQIVDLGGGAALPDWAGARSFCSSRRPSARRRRPSVQSSHHASQGPARVPASRARDPPSRGWRLDSGPSSRASGHVRRLGKLLIGLRWSTIGKTPRDLSGTSTRRAQFTPWAATMFGPASWASAQQLQHAGLLRVGLGEGSPCPPAAGSGARQGRGLGGVVGVEHA